MSSDLGGKVAIFSGYAGSGKDFYASQTRASFAGNSVNIAFADRFKNIIARHIPANILGLDAFNDKSNLEVLDLLKNDYPEIKIYGDLNVRKFMQKLLGDTVRSIQKDIHCAYLMQDYYNIMEEDKSTLFTCTDNRYENEQDYLLNINSIQDSKDRLNFVLSQIGDITRNIDNQNISSIFNKNFSGNEVGVNELDRSFLENIKFDFMRSIKELKEMPEPDLYIPCVKFSNYDFAGSSRFELGNLGLFRIFRKAVSDDFNIENSTEECLINEISIVASITNEKAKELLNNYASWGLKCSDIEKYGVCRTSPILPSERELVDKRRFGVVIQNIGKEGVLDVKSKAVEVLDLLTDLDDVGYQKKTSSKLRIR